MLGGHGNVILTALLLSRWGSLLAAAFLEISNPKNQMVHRDNSSC